MFIVPLYGKKPEAAPTAEAKKDNSDTKLIIPEGAGSKPGFSWIHTGMEKNTEASGYFVLRPDIPSKQDGGGAGRDNITQRHHIGTTQNYEDPDLGKLNG